MEVNSGLWGEGYGWKRRASSGGFFHKDETLARLLVFVFIFCPDKKKKKCEVFTLAEQIEL